MVMISRRFRGPDVSGNGGYSAGLVAAAFGPGRTVEVTLRRPPPLDVQLDVAVSGTAAQLTYDGAVVADAKIVESDLAPLEPLSLAHAEAAMAQFAGVTAHPFPNCFTCGNARAEGDGLRIFPGPVADGLVASTWTPDASLLDENREVPAEIVWAALDCPGGWSAITEDRPMVLGRMAVRLESLPTVGQKYAIAGQALENQGRKSRTAVSMFDADGRVLATAEQVWIVVDPALFNRP
jgi:hypothetical protein